MKWPSDPATQVGAPDSLLTGSARARAFALAAVLLTFFSVNPAAAQGPVSLTVLRPDGTTTQAHLAGLSDGELRVFDAQRRFTTLTWGEVALLTLHSADSDSDSAADAPIAPPTDRPPVASGVLHLTDGQRLAGVWAGAADGGESLRWIHPGLGPVVVPLEQVAGWTAAGASALPPDAAGDDAMRLTSGERLTGFLHLPDPADGGADVLLLARADAPDGPAVPVPAGSVAAATLANPSVVSAAGSSAAPARVTLHDGSRLHARGLSVGAGAASFDAQIAGQVLRVAVSAGAVWRIALTDNGRDVQDLANRVVRTTPTPPHDRALWGPGVVGASVTPTGYRLAAPAQLAVALPPGARVVVGRAVLDLPEGLAAERAAWAGCTLRISGMPQVALKLSAAHPQTPFRVSVPAGATELVFTLDPGPRGPVLDVVRIEDARVLTARP